MCAVFLCLLFIYPSHANPGAPLPKEPIIPIPLDHNVDSQLAELGEKLFHETMLSGDNSVSCATCHSIENYGVDGYKVSIGIEGRTGTVNAPTVMNSRFNFAQFWDGRAANLVEQVQGPITNEVEMGATWDIVIDRLNNNQEYRESFAKLYPNRGITPETIGDAIRSYEYTLNTVHSPFDQFLRGDKNAITKQQKRGYELFKSYGCVACHQGVNVGGNMYQRLGTFKPFFTETNLNNKADLGRFNVTGEEKDFYVFKVPSLRLATHTAPYFHDGSTKTLNEAIRIMAKYQLGREIPNSDISDIESFIRSLSGQYQKGQ